MSWNEKLAVFCTGLTCRSIGRRAGLSHKTVLGLLCGKGTMDSLIRVMEDGLHRDVAQVFVGY